MMYLKDPLHNIILSKFLLIYSYYVKIKLQTQPHRKLSDGFRFSTTRLDSS